MDMSIVVARFREYAAQQQSESEKNFYEDIANALGDEDFLEILHCSGYANILSELERRFSTGEINEYTLQQYKGNLGQIQTKYSIRKLEDEIEIPSLRQEVRAVKQNITDAKNDIQNIKNVSSILSGAQMLQTYATDFDKEAKEHEKKARHWIGWLIVSIIGLIVLTASLLCIQLSDFAVLNQIIADEFKEKLEVPRIVALAIKGSIVAAYAQIPLFLKKNYYAERHLEQANIHRRNVLRSLHAVYNVVSDESERNRLRVIGATTAFSEPESGFITRKEGAGSDNSNIDAILKSFIKS